MSLGEGEGGNFDSGISVSCCMFWMRPKHVKLFVKQSCSLGFCFGSPCHVLIFLAPGTVNWCPHFIGCKRTDIVFG